MNNAGSQMLCRDDTVLVIIDMQERLLPVMPDKESILRNVVRLARFAQIINLPVILTEQEKLGATVPEVREALPADNPITKLEFDAAQRPEFMERLNQLGKKSIIMTGIESHICIVQTTLHLLPEYNIHVVSDAIASRNPANREIALARMRQAGAVISSAEMVIYELLGKAGTEEFKATLPLVK